MANNSQEIKVLTSASAQRILAWDIPNLREAIEKLGEDLRFGDATAHVLAEARLSVDNIEVLFKEILKDSDELANPEMTDDNAS